MKSTFTRYSITLLLLFITYANFGQILSYSNATNGSLNSVAANATGTNLLRVNGAATAASPCSTGFSTSNFSSTTTYSSSLAAVEVSVTPNSGFALNVTGFTADIGRTGAGPASVLFAYSTNGGSTWTAQSSNQSIQKGRCGKVHTTLWSTSFSVNAPASLKFRIYGFNANTISGTEQILNLKINGTVSATASCGVASGLSASSITSSSATLNWGAVSGASSYNIQYRKTGTSTWTSNTSTTSPLAVSGLTLSTTYEFQVQTVCSGGITSAFSSSATFTTSVASCGVASGLGAINITSSSATLDWNDVSGATGYNIQYRKTGTTTWTSKTSTTSSLAVSGLTSSTTYEFQVQTVCSGGITSAFSSSATFTTTAASCGVASGLSASSITSSSATLNWGAVSGASSYNIQYRKTGTTTWTSNTSTTSPLAVSGLTLSTTYEFQVQTVCSGTTSAFSSSATFTTSAASCGVASGLGAINITSSSATLDWNDVSGATGYNIQYRKTGTTTWTSKTSTTSSLAVTGLTSSTTYEFQVQTVCSGGTSTFSSSATFTTSSTGTNPVPAFTHIVVVIGENTNASSVFGSTSAPYINALAAAGAKFTNSFAIEHPSQPNYLDLYAGSNQGVTDDSYITTKFTTANLGKELINAGKTYTTYSEGLPSVGYDGASSGLYVRKHNPSANWMGTGTNQIPTTTNQPFTAFPTNYANLPSVSFVVPNLCNDGHDVCAPLNNSILQYDTWVKNNLDAYKQWCINNNSLLIVTYDEDDFTTVNKIATVFYGANVLQGSYSQTISHYTVLRTIEDAFRLTTHAGAAASSTPIDFCWTPAARVYSSTLNSNNTSTINIFPNPANDKISIILKNGVSKNISWELTNISGAKYKTGNVTNIPGDGKIEIGVNDLKNGVYFLRITDGVNTRQNKFIIAR